MLKSTAQTIVLAAQKTLQTEGFAGATSRAISRTGGFNQALIFYHFGSLEDLLVAALGQTSEARLARYRDRLAGVEGVQELVPAMAELFAEDTSAGHVQIVAQMVAGSVNRPELATRVMALLEPWIEFAEETLAQVLPPGAPTNELAYAIVVWYLGANLVTHLDPDRARIEALMRRVEELAPLLDSFLPPATGSAESPGPPSTSPGRASAT
jgi:AcrR family transcriptional regulator